MEEPNRKKTVIEKLLENSTEAEQNITFCLAYIPSPVSIDLLSALAEVPVVKVLNIMESLRKKKIVQEKKEFGKGIYFFDNDDFAGFTGDGGLEKKEGVLRGIIDYYIKSLPQNTEKTLVLADLYRKLEDAGDEGLACIQEAADILSRDGQKEKAVLYYSYILENCAKKGPDGSGRKVIPEGVLEKLPITDYLSLPPEKQVLFLTGAEEAAKCAAEWDTLVRIKLALGHIHRSAGRRDEASRYSKEAWEVAEKTGDKNLQKLTILSLGEFLFWEGNIAEAVRRYDAVVGNLEEFGDDEGVLKSIAMLGWCHVMCGRVSRGLGMIEAARSRTLARGFQHAAAYSDLMSALSFVEIRKIAEARACVDRIFSAPSEALSSFMLWAAYGCMAFIHFCAEEYEKAHEYHGKMIEQARMVGVIQYRGSHDYESLEGLEKRGFFHKEMSLNGEIDLMLDSGNPHMMGIALRYRALQAIKKRDTKGRAFLDLRNSEKQLARAGAKIELARTRLVLGDAYLKEGEVKVAQSYLEKAWTELSKIDKGLFPKDLLVIMMPQEQKIEFMIDRIININESLTAARDMPSFLERVINLAMDFVMAMRGAFFSADDSEELRILASRNFDPMMLKTEQAKVIMEVVARTCKSGIESVMPGLAEAEGLSDKVLADEGITSLICMPAVLGDKTYGYLYLDNRLGGESFPENQLPFVRLLCNQIAVGLSNILMYEEMRGLKDRLEEEAVFYKKEMGITAPVEMIIGKSQEIATVIDQVRQVASTDSSVLILGETGVGKELVAKAIHHLSERRDGPFIPVNLASLPHELVASELFGHEKGAFTGAHERQKGRFELADGGTIFLDEIGDLPAAVQVKLLRVLQEGSFERLGSARPIRSNFRVIAATNKNLVQEVEKGTFRRDLYYRLNVFPVHVPPLRERKDDIVLLSNYFIDRFARKMGKKIKQVPAETQRKLMEYPWPGNVRELEHFIERAVIISDGTKISFSGMGNSGPHSFAAEETGAQPLADMERGYIEKVLTATHWRVSGPSGAAVILKMKPTTLISRMKKLGIKKPEVSL